jgi:CHASE1-domain containing sensor protein
MPALPLDDAGPYVAAAYLVFLGLILVYVAIMATRLSRVEKEIDEVARLVEARIEDEPPAERVQERVG